ncbi:MAG TPA: hypothetical protein VHQ87_15860 [Rhizobacter sp.]|nr:hypothetical protein [Rhizobacter sp.]
MTSRSTTATPFWSTASFGDSTDITLPSEFSELGQHMDSCKGSHGRWFALQCAGEIMNRFIAARFVTTLVVATVVMGFAALAS